RFSRDWSSDVCSSDLIAVPDLDDPDKIARGAGLYEMVCADCHGSPTRPANRIADELSPPPPLLTERMQQWHPAQRLFFTVKHGKIGRASCRECVEVLV